MSTDAEFADWISDLNDLYVSASHGEIWAKVKEFRAMVAHELAEKQRAWAATQGGRELRIEPEQLPSIVQAAVGLAADLIDPEVPK